MTTTPLFKNGAETATTGGIRRAISPDFLARLDAEASKDGWWKDVLHDPRLIVALRGRYLNVYWKGQSLFHVSPRGSGLHVTTHEKYLLDPSLAGQVPLSSNGEFDLGDLTSKAFVKRYDSDALAKMKRAAALFSGAEKKGCHHIATANSNVIDVEIAFPGKVVIKGGRETTSPRVDIASLEPMDDKNVRLVFWEAKEFYNGELVARGEDIPVVDQINGYRSYVSSGDHKGQIEACYEQVAKDLTSIKRMGWVRTLSPLFEDIASGRKRLTLGAEPKVGLLIFGFDAAQRDHATWRKHLERLTMAIADVKAVGDPKTIKLER